MKMFFATWLFETSQGISLTKANANKRLLSYYHTKEKQEQFPVYVQEGKNENMVGGNRTRK